MTILEIGDEKQTKGKIERIAKNVRQAFLRFVRGHSVKRLPYLLKKRGPAVDAIDHLAQVVFRRLSAQAFHPGGIFKSAAFRLLLADVRFSPEKVKKQTQRGEILFVCQPVQMDAHIPFVGRNLPVVHQPPLMTVTQKTQRQSCKIEIFQQLEIGVLFAVSLPRIQQFVPMFTLQKADYAVRRLLIVRCIFESLKRLFIFEQSPVRLHLLPLNGDALTP